MEDTIPIEFSAQEISALIEACNTTNNHHWEARQSFWSHGEQALQKLIDAEMSLQEGKVVGT